MEVNAILFDFVCGAQSIEKYVQIKEMFVLKHVQMKPQLTARCC